MSGGGGKQQPSMLTEMHAEIANVIKKGISGITIDTTSIYSNVPAEDRDVVSNIVKIVSLICVPSNHQGSPSAPFDVVPMKDREYSIGVSVGGPVLSIDRIVDAVRVYHPNVLGVFVNMDTTRQKLPITISVHISCSPRTIVDAIYCLTSKPRGSYAVSIAHAIDDSSAIDFMDTSPSGSGSSTAPPPPKKRKRNETRDEDSRD